MTAPLILIPENPCPAGADPQWLMTPDGARLRMVTWLPKAAGLSRCRGSVFLFGGRTEFAEKYFEVIGELLARDFAVTTLDWRGQGLSDHPLPDWRKGHIDRFETYLDDMALFMTAMAGQMPKPWFALAHSMGGHILQRALHDHPDWFSGAVMTAPMLGLRLGSANVQRLLRGVAEVACALGLGGSYVPGGNASAADAMPFKDNFITNCEARYGVHQALIRAEWKLGLGAPTMCWLRAAFRSMALASDAAYLNAITTPVLILEAPQERLVDNKSLERAATLMRAAEIDTIEESRHEILMEEDACRIAFWSDFDNFMTKAEDRLRS